MSLLTGIRVGAVVAMAATFSLTVGCGGSTTSGDVVDTSGSQFVSDETTTGKLILDLKEDTLPVAGTSGFFARVVDEAGVGVAGVQVACDSEKGVAILDPSLGRAMTGSDGDMSGVFGCESPGSFEIGCRVANGGNKRQFSTVKCSGDVPIGFSGFPGAGGGGLGLGGGVVDPEDGGRGQGDGLIRISEIEVTNVFGKKDTVPEVDTVSSVCDNKTPADPKDDFIEGFGDDEVTITISNESDRLVRFTGYEYVVKGGGADGGNIQSPRIRDFAQAGARAKEAVTLSAQIFDANAGGYKSYANSGQGGTVIPPNLGRRNITLTVFGVDDRGDEVQASASISVSFDNFDNCSTSSK
jgi:hypothetical protein